MTIHRPTAKALASAFLVACSHGTAAAAGYDLDCTVLGDDGQPRRNTAAFHVQVDPENGRWCDGRCDTVRDVARLADGEIVLSDEVFYGDISRLVFHSAEGLLIEEYGLGQTYERTTRYACRIEDFGGFAPYLAKDPQPLRRWELAGPKDFLKGDDGKQLGGSVGFQVAVDTRGKPGDCTVVQTSGNPLLDSHTCILVMARLEFSPATDRKGVPIEASYSSTVNWMTDDD